jgi:hypothetical protein
MNDQYAPPADAASCPHCGTEIRWRVTRVAREVLYFSFRVVCRQCRGEWGEVRDARGAFRSWLTSRPVVPGRPVSCAR